MQNCLILTQQGVKKNKNRKNSVNITQQGLLSSLVHPLNLKTAYFHIGRKLAIMVL